MGRGAGSSPLEFSRGAGELSLHSGAGGWPPRRSGSWSRRAARGPTGSLLRGAPHCQGPALGALPVLGRSSGAQHPRLSPELASPCAPASPVCGPVLHPRKEGVRLPSDTFADVAQSRQELFNTRELQGGGRRGGSILALALRLESRARRLYQV